MNLNNNTFSDIKIKLDKIDRDREKILTLSRQMVRNCSVAIKAIHREDEAQYQEKVKVITIHYDNEMINPYYDVNIIS